MKVKEFRMLVHGPFATNIYLDLGELEELKRLSLTKTEIESLKNLKNKSRTEKKINGWPWKSKDSSTQQQQQENLDDINNLKSQGFVEYQKLNVAEIFLRYIWKKITGKVDSVESKKLSPTTYGLDELRRIEEFEKAKNTSIDKNFVTNFLRNTNFKKVKLEDHKNSYEQFRSYFFSNEVQAYVLAKLSVANFSRNINTTTEDLSSSTQGVELRFENNVIHIFASGIGIISSQVTARFYDEVDITKIKKKDLEDEVKKVIDNIFTDYVSPLIAQFSKAANDNFQLFHGIFDFEPNKVATRTWLHTIYWFSNDQFFKDDSESGFRNLDRTFLKEFTVLLEQIPDNPLDLQDRYVFYGLGKSLILTGNDVSLHQNWVNEIGSLVEIGQYFCFDLNLLEYFLSRKISELMVDEPITSQHPDKLKYKIKNIERIRSASIRYLEQFRSGIKALIHAGQLSLVDKLEKGWHLDSLEDDILVKLHSLEKELSCREQSLLSHKQDRFSNIAFVFTVISLASVMGGVVALSPLKGQFQAHNPMIFFSSELFFVMFSTAVVIGVTMYLVMKSYGLRQKLRHKSEKLLQRVYKERGLKNTYSKKIDDSSRLYQGQDKDLLWKHREQIRKEVNMLYIGGKISKTNYEKLDSSIPNDVE